MSASVQVRDLTKTFALAERAGRAVSLREALRTGRREAVAHREVRALDGVSFTISEGERVGIIGRNGAGKTTLLSILAGIAEASSGTIAVEGDIHAMLTIGAVLRDEATGRENIALDAAMHGRSQAEVEALSGDIIAFSELGEFIDRPVRTYSSGMKARLAFSMGAFINPDILIIDETLSVGDAFFAEKAARQMKEIARRGRIVIVVSHALSSIVDMCERCLWLDRGRLVMDGPAKAVTEAYEAAVEQADEAEIARKFGSPPSAQARPEAGRLQEVSLVQGDQPLAGRARVLVPLTVTVRGELANPAGAPDLVLSVQRVDGRPIMRRCLSETGGRLPATGPFRLSVSFDPFILGADLYRLDATLRDREGAVHVLSRVFEVVDEDGQFGGKPLLLYPPVLTARPIED